MKVIADCWEHVFDVLPLRDILAMSKTCQHMLQIGGHYLHNNSHGAITVDLIMENPYLCVNTNERIDLACDEFLRFVGAVHVKNTNHFQAYSDGNLWSSLTALYLCNAKVLNRNDIQIFRNVSDRLESINLALMKVEDDSVGQFLASCPELNFLRFDLVRFASEGAANAVFQRKYPKLIDFQCINNRATLPSSLASFLGRNPSIKNVAIDYSDLSKIESNTTTIRLDCLSVIMGSRSIDKIEFVTKLKAFHKDGYYKRLHISTCHGLDSADLQFVDEMSSFNALEVLHLEDPPRSLHLAHLKELTFTRITSDVDLEAMAKKLINRERLWIGGILVDEISPFLQHSKKLKSVILGQSEKALDLYNMNESRKMCGVQRKVRIGIGEPQYLATKWNKKNVAYDFIEIVRLQTIEKQFNHIISYPYKV